MHAWHACKLTYIPTYGRACMHTRILTYSRACMHTHMQLFRCGVRCADRWTCILPRLSFPHACACPQTHPRAPESPKKAKIADAPPRSMPLAHARFAYNHCTTPHINPACQHRPADGNVSTHHARLFWQVFVTCRSCKKQLDLGGKSTKWRWGA